MSDLTARLAALKESHNTGVVSECKNPTPLWVFLMFHMKANREAYIDHMAGARKLLSFLSPLEIPEYPNFSNTDKVPDILRTYEMTKLAEFLVPPAPMSNEYLRKIRVMERAILDTMIEEVLPRFRKEGIEL